MTHKIKIIHIIDSLAVGGAESFLANLVKEQSKDLDFKIIVLQDIGPIGSDLQKLGFSLESLSLTNFIMMPIATLKLYREIITFKPDIVQCWMYHSNFIGGIVSKLARVKAILWSIHNFNLDRGILKRRTRVLVWMLSKLSRKIPTKIIYCSEASSEVHIKIGFDCTKTEFIPNGVSIPKDTNRVTSVSTHYDLNLPKNKFIIGMVGRYDIQKNHLGFLQSLKILSESNLKFHAVIVGRGCDVKNHELTNLINLNNLKDKISLLGQRHDIPLVMQTFDLFVLPSIGEAFPLSLCEAMAQSIPCIGNNVGDVSKIIGDPRFVTSKWNAKDFAQLILDIANLSSDERNLISRRLYQRVKENFSIESSALKYLTLYRKILFCVE